MNSQAKLMAPMRLINHGPGAIRIVAPDKRGSRTIPPVLLETGQTWTPEPGMGSVSIACAFGPTMLELEGAAPAVVGACGACRGDGFYNGCEVCRGSGEELCPS